MALEVIGNEITNTKISIIKEAICPSLSGRTKLTYSVGRTADKGLLVRIDKNSRTGKFNNQWISLDTILELINEAESPFRWSVLLPIFEGQSVNSAGFMMAVLMNEGVVTAAEQGYELQDADALKKTIKPKRTRKTAEKGAES